MTTPDTPAATQASPDATSTSPASTNAAQRNPTSSMPRWLWPFVVALLAIGVHFLLSVPRGPMEYVKPEDPPQPAANDDDELPRVPQRPTRK